MPDRFNYSKKGYDVNEVDNYIDSLEDIIKSYKDKDAAIKNAIINAQIAADNIIKSAEEDAIGIKEICLEKLEELDKSIIGQKKLIQKFQEEYNYMVGKYIHEFNDTEVLKLYSKINELEEFISEVQTEIKGHDIDDLSFDKDEKKEEK